MIAGSSCCPRSMAVRSGSSSIWRFLYSEMMPATVATAMNAKMPRKTAAMGAPTKLCMRCHPVIEPFRYPYRGAPHGVWMQGRRPARNLLLGRENPPDRGHGVGVLGSLVVAVTLHARQSQREASGIARARLQVAERNLHHQL